MYQSLIQPIFLYGSDIWGMNTAAQRSLDKVFCWFLKILLNVKRNTCYTSWWNWYVSSKQPLSSKHLTVHLNNLPPDSVVKYVFLESKRLCKLGHRNWYTKVWELAQSYNLNINSLDDSNATKHLIKSNVTAKYVSHWHAKLQDINNNPILKNCKPFEKEFKWECYLSGVKDPKYRKTLTKPSNQFPHFGNRTGSAH